MEEANARSELVGRERWTVTTPLDIGFFFPSSIIPKTCFFFCWTKMEYIANFVYHQSRLANEMSRDEAFSHYVKCIFWKHEKTNLTIFFAKNCINIKSSIQDPHREIRMFCIIKWSRILFVKAETRWQRNPLRGILSDMLLRRRSLRIGWLT